MGKNEPTKRPLPIWPIQKEKKETDNTIIFVQHDTTRRNRTKTLERHWFSEARLTSRVIFFLLLLLFFLVLFSVSQQQQQHSACVAVRLAWSGRSQKETHQRRSQQGGTSPVVCIGEFSPWKISYIKGGEGFTLNDQTAVGRSSSTVNRQQVSYLL
jgi:hypothetical protein